MFDDRRRNNKDQEQHEIDTEGPDGRRDRNVHGRYARKLKHFVLIAGRLHDRLHRIEKHIVRDDAENALLISAKTGLGIEDVLEALVTRLPPPQGDAEAPLKALLVDSWYDSYQGVIALCRVFEGRIKKGTKIRLHHSGKEFEVQRVGTFTQKFNDVNEIANGEVGAIVCGIRDVRDMKVGDTVMDANNLAKESLGGFKEAKPMVFCGGSGLLDSGIS